MFDLIALVPLAAGAALVVAPIAWGAFWLWPPYGAIVVVAIWWAPAPWFFFRGPQRLLARLWCGCREPTTEESRSLADPWHEVTAKAGVCLDRFHLMVTDSEELNAYATGGSIVAVTSHAVRTLPTRQLAAILAHELAHHLDLHVIWASIRFQLAFPVRTPWRAAVGTWKLVRRAYRGALKWHTAAGFLGVGLLAVIAAVLTVALAAPAALGFAGTGLSGLARTRAECDADRTAADLGYGSVLLGLLEALIEKGGAKPLIARRARELRRHLQLTMIS